ncbi:MAG: hydrogenase expression/formation C-terminal domain-containing protein [Pseudomonadota bacterium]
MSEIRKNPFTWEDEAPQGVLAPFEGEDSVDACSSEASALSNLLGMPTGNSMHGPGELDLSEATNPAVLDMLAKVSDALKAAASDGKAWRRRLDHLSDDERSVFYDALGTGEVSLVISPGAPDEGDVQITETVLPGVWIGRAEDASGVLRSQWVEVADAPYAMRELAITRPRSDINLDMLTAPRDAMNVMGVLSEVRAKAQDWRPGTPNHVVNFTLFPMTEADTSFLTKVLGESGVRASSGGYGSARVIMTALRNVWAVQFLNGLGAVILDTLEVGDIPSAVLASQEDFEDSAARLDEIRGAYAP